MMGGFGVFGLGMVLMVLFWVAIIGGAIWLVATLARGNQRTMATANKNSSVSGQERPIDIIQARYARGEITQEQYEELKRDLAG